MIHKYLTANKRCESWRYQLCVPSNTNENKSEWQDSAKFHWNKVTCLTCLSMKKKGRTMNNKINHPRIKYRATIVSLYNTLKGSTLKYEDPCDKMKSWKDLVLRDIKGKEIARMLTYGTYGNNDLRYNTDYKATERFT